MGENEQTEPQVEEEEMMQQLRQELKNLTVSDHLLFMMHSLSALAVERMGLTQEAEGQRNLAEARLAVDAYRALLELVGNVRPREEMVGHRSVLSQLQMNYVEVLRSGEGGTQSPGEAEESSPREAEEPSSGGTEAPQSSESERRLSGEESAEPPTASDKTTRGAGSEAQAEVVAEAPADGQEAEE